MDNYQLYGAGNYDSSTGAYYGGELDGVTVTASGSDSGSSGGGGGWMGNIGGWLSGVAQIGNAWANIQSAQNGSSPSQYTPIQNNGYTPQPQGNNNMLLFIGAGLLVVLLLFFAFKK